MTANNKKLTTETFILKANKIHNNFYDYSLVEYINTKTKIKIICPIHGIFEQTPNQHLTGRGCRKCFYIRHRRNIDEFLTKVNQIHNNKFDYSLVEYVNDSSNIKIICPIHGIFEQTPNNHLKRHGCPICKSSKGEKYIIQILKGEKVNFIPQHKFKECRYERQLPFDFFLSDYNLCIEYQGRQHFEPVNHWGGLDELESTKLRDTIKRDFCNKNNIRLLEIPYYEINLVQKIKEQLNAP